MEVVARDKYDHHHRIGLLVTAFLELLVLAGLSVLAYYLRATDKFPIRVVRFRCNDASLSESLQDGKNSMNKFAYNAEVPYVAIVVISFCLPPLMMLICELCRWRLTAHKKLSISIGCAVCNVSTTFRRIVRFTCVFIVGILMTLIFTDVTKLFVGRLRPVFLEECQVNQSVCASAPNNLYTDDICNQSDSWRLRWARQSFPSFHASITAYSSIFMALYWQNVVGHGLHCGVFGPFLSFSFIITSLLCGLSRYALNYSHWSDIAVGYALGGAIAVFIGVFTLRNFLEKSDLLGRCMPDLLPSYDNYAAGRDKVPWHWAPWHWTVQDYLDNKVDRRVEAPYYHRSAGETAHTITDDVLRRHSSRDRNLNDASRGDNVYY